MLSTGTNISRRSQQRSHLRPPRPERLKDNSMTTPTPLSLNLAIESLPLAKPFRISGHVFTDTPVVLVTLSDGEHSGRGEASGVYYLGDDVPAMAAAIESVRGAVEAGVTREQLQALLPAGGARNAIDCALW